MLFLGKVSDFVKTAYENIDTDKNDSIRDFFPAAVGLMLSETLKTSNCDDITYVQLNQGTFDEINLEVYDKDTVKDDIDNYVFPENWNKFTVLNSNFNNHNLAAGNFDYMIDEVKSMIIKRRPHNSVEPYLPIFEKNIYTNTNEFNFTFTDYLVRNGKEYEYILLPILKNGIEGTPIHVIYEDDISLIDFDGVFICEPNSTYESHLNIELTAQKNKPSSIITPIGQKYPYVLCSTENNYYTGTVKGLFVQYENGNHHFEDSWDFREKFNEFLLNGKVKVLKYYDGRIWLVNIYDNVTNDRDGHDDIIISSFSWAEIGDVSDVYALYDNGFISYNPYTKALSVSDEYDYSDVIYTAYIRNEKGIPVMSASVKLYDTNKNIISITESNSAGQFSFGRLKDGDYIISISHNDYIDKTITLTVDNHKPIAESSIIMNDKNLAPVEDDRSYLPIWKVLHSTENEDFETGAFITNEDIRLPSSLSNSGNTNTYVILESDFIVKKGDIVSVDIKALCQNDSGVWGNLDNTGDALCGAVIYTGMSDFEFSETSSDEYNKIMETYVSLNPQDKNTEKHKYLNTYSETAGYLKLMLYAEHIDSNYVYSQISSVSVTVNGQVIFDMG